MFSLKALDGSKSIPSCRLEFSEFGNTIQFDKTSIPFGDSSWQWTGLASSSVALHVKAWWGNRIHSHSVDLGWCFEAACKRVGRKRTPLSMCHWRTVPVLWIHTGLSSPHSGRINQTPWFAAPSSNRISILRMYRPSCLGTHKKFKQHIISDRVQRLCVSTR